MDEDPEPAGDISQNPDAVDQNRSQNYTQLAAMLVLLIATPMLMLSGLALALFFAMPQRFNSLLARLPGESALRSVMIFAPAALVAIIVLAVLYALEPDEIEVERPSAASQSPDLREISEKFLLQRLGAWILPFSITLFLLFIAIRSAAFLSPTSFDNLLDRIPGGEIVGLLLGPGLLLLLLLIILALRMTFGGSDKKALLPVQGFDRAREFLLAAGPARLAVGSMLLFSIPLLFFSLLALTGFQARPGRVLDLLLQLPQEVVLRLGLLFAPTSLFIVVALGVQFMIRRTIDEDTPPASTLDTLLFFVQRYGSWALLGGLLVASSVIVGLIVGMMVLLLR